MDARSFACGRARLRNGLRRCFGPLVDCWWLGYVSGSGNFAGLASPLPGTQCSRLNRFVRIELLKTKQSNDAHTKNVRLASSSGRSYSYVDLSDQATLTVPTILLVRLRLRLASLQSLLLSLVFLR